MAKQNVAEQFVDILVKAGVKRLYGVVGDSLNPVVDAVRRNAAIDWVHVRHEETAAFAAGAEAQITGNLAACAGSCGPGNLHLINGLYDAHRSMAPVLALASHIPSSEIGTGYFQETHPDQLFRDRNTRRSSDLSTSSTASTTPTVRWPRCSRSPPTSPAPRSAPATSRRPTPTSCSEIGTHDALPISPPHQRPLRRPPFDGPGARARLPHPQLRDRHRLLPGDPPRPAVPRSEHTTLFRSLHLINGLYDAHRSMAPVLALASHIPSSEIGTGYFQETHPDQLF